MSFSQKSGASKDELRLLLQLGRLNTQIAALRARVQRSRQRARRR